MGSTQTAKPSLLIVPSDVSDISHCDKKIKWTKNLFLHSSFVLAVNLYRDMFFSFYL